MIPNKSSGPRFGETVYISEVNGDGKTKSNAQVAMNKNSDPVQKVFPYGWLGKTVLSTHIFPKFWNCPKRVELGSSYSGCRLIYARPTVAAMKFDVTQ